MRVLACGSRDWTNEAVVRIVLGDLAAQYAGEQIVLIHGDNGNDEGTVGLDRMAARIGRELGFEIEPYPAEWTRLRRAAGPVRNQKIIDEGKPDRVVAFSDHITDSKGTNDMLNRAHQARVPISLYTSSYESLYRERQAKEEG